TILEDNQVTDYLIRVVQPRLSAIEGVQRADILGGRTFAIRAWLKADRMAALNVSPSQVRQALSANNYLAAVGQTKGAMVQVNLTASTDLRSVDEFKKLVIRQQNGALVRLEDVAEVVLTLTETVLIVIVVIFLFLGSLRSVLVPLVAIPVSLIGAIFLMQVLGFTVNLLTLLAVVLSVGLVVDDAIVVVENVERHIR